MTNVYLSPHPALAQAQLEIYYQYGHVVSINRKELHKYGRATGVDVSAGFRGYFADIVTDGVLILSRGQRLKAWAA